MNRLLSSLCVLFAAGCNQGPLGLSSGDAAAAVDGSLSSPDGGAPAGDGGGALDSGFMPAAHLPLPQIPYHGGATIKGISLVTITWKGDPLEGPLQAFDKWIIQSPQWTDVLSEYIVKPGTQEAVYSIPMPAPPTLDDKDIQSLLKSLVANKLVPPVNENRLYSVYVPDGTKVTNSFGGSMPYTSCVDMLGYQGIGPTVQGGAILYTVTPRCHQNMLTDIDYTTWISSGNLARAATDPTYGGWLLDMPDPRAPFGGDVAGLCQSFLLHENGYAVTAYYSNAAALADMRPCLPAPVGPMFGSTPDPDNLTIPPGGSGTTMVTIYSTAPLAKPLRLTVAGFPMNLVTVNASAQTVTNGDQVRVDVSLSQAAQPTQQYVVYLRLDAPDYHWVDYVTVSVK